MSNDMALVVFPKGMMSDSGWLQRATSGSAIIALCAGGSILLVGVVGTERIEGLI